MTIARTWGGGWAKSLRSAPIGSRGLSHRIVTFSHLCQQQNSDKFITVQPVPPNFKLKIYQRLYWRKVVWILTSFGTRGCTLMTTLTGMTLSPILLPKTPLEKSVMNNQDQSVTKICKMVCQWVGCNSGRLPNLVVGGWDEELELPRLSRGNSGRRHCWKPWRADWLHIGMKSQKNKLLLPTKLISTFLSDPGPIIVNPFQ